MLEKIKVKLTNKETGIISIREYIRDYTRFDCGILVHRLETLGEVVDLLSFYRNNFNFSWVIDKPNDNDYFLNIFTDSDKHTEIEIY